MQSSNPIPPPQNGSDNSVDTFLNEVSKPTTPALGTNPTPDIPIPTYYDIPKATPPPAPPQDSVNGNGEPNFIFGDDIETDTETATPGEQPKKQSSEYMDTVLRGIITAEEFATSRICAIVAGTDDATPFKYQEEDKQVLLTLLEPFRDIIADKCPAALPLFLVYGGLKTDQAFRASKMRKTRLANEAAKQSPEVAEKVAKAAAGESAKERTNFKINAKGEYLNDRYGKYLKVGEPRELAEIKDIERILEVNKVSDVQKAFDLSDDYLRSKGVEL